MIAEHDEQRVLEKAAFTHLAKEVTERIIGVLDRRLAGACRLGNPSVRKRVRTMVGDGEQSREERFARCVQRLELLERLAEEILIADSPGVGEDGILVVGLFAKMVEPVGRHKGRTPSNNPRPPVMNNRS